MKKRLVLLVAGALALSAFAGCGANNQPAATPATETKEETTEAAAPVAETETETEKPSAFEADLESYEALIASAPVDAYYAFADLAEMSDALIIAPGELTFDNGDGTMAATGGWVYGLGPDGNIMEYGYVEGGGTATPLAVGEGYVLFYGGRDYMNKVTLDTDAGALNTDEGEYFDDYENAITIAFMPVATWGNSDGEEAMGPSDFVQEQSGKLEFADYDEIISFLKPGQGYVILQVGDDDNVLAVAEEVNKDDKTATSASCYVMKDGKPVEVGYVIANGIPLRAKDGIVYGGDKDNYESNFLNPTGDGIMAKAYIYKADADGKTEYGGFMRETNSFDQDQDFTGGEEEFNALIKERDSMPVIEFTIVE